MCGLVTSTGNVLIQPMYDEISHLDDSDLFAVRLGSNWTLVNSDNDTILDEGFDRFVHVRSNAVVAVQEGLYGIVNRNGEIIVPFEFEELSFAFGANYIARRDGALGLINLSGDVLLDFEYVNITYISEGDFLKADTDEIHSVIYDNTITPRASGIVSELDTERGYIKLHTGEGYVFYNFRFEERRASDVLGTNNLFVSRRRREIRICERLPVSRLLDIFTMMLKSKIGTDLLQLEEMGCGDLSIESEEKFLLHL